MLIYKFSSNAPIAGNSEAVYPKSRTDLWSTRLTNDRLLQCQRFDCFGEGLKWIWYFQSSFRFCRVI